MFQPHTGGQRPRQKQGQVPNNKPTTLQNSKRWEHTQQPFCLCFLCSIISQRCYTLLFSSLSRPHPPSITLTAAIQAQLPDRQSLALLCPGPSHKHYQRSGGWCNHGNHSRQKEVQSIKIQQWDRKKHFLFAKFSLGLVSSQPVTSGEMVLCKAITKAKLSGQMNANTHFRCKHRIYALYYCC